MIEGKIFRTAGIAGAEATRTQDPRHAAECRDVFGVNQALNSVSAPARVSSPPAKARGIGRRGAAAQQNLIAFKAQQTLALRGDAL